MIVSELDVLRAAHLHLERHGDQAVAKAREMVRTLKECADNDGADTWLRIIVAIETMRQEASGPHSSAPGDRNSFGALESAGNKPELKREWDFYIRTRRKSDSRA